MGAPVFFWKKKRKKKRSTKMNLFWRRRFLKKKAVYENEPLLAIKRLTRQILLGVLRGEVADFWSEIGVQVSERPQSREVSRFLQSVNVLPFRAAALP
jgi:hypothetical protein